MRDTTGETECPKALVSIRPLHNIQALQVFLSKYSCISHLVSNSRKSKEESKEETNGN